jgi:hypothetical protein
MSPFVILFLLAVFVFQGSWVRKDAIKEGVDAKNAFWIGLIFASISLGLSVFLLNWLAY